jgi:ribosomal protein S25
LSKDAKALAKRKEEKKEKKKEKEEEKEEEKKEIPDLFNNLVRRPQKKIKKKKMYTVR